jgi:2,3,4,5-tetrahydropyridine-2-carboxylate N-succinyltransferase
MVEGRISSSAIVGSGSDIGGGASILGVLSGTDGDPISIGENTLLGANSTTGISLGDGCILDGGLAIFAGTKIYINDENIRAIEEINSGTKLSNDIKAIELSGLHGIHFRLDSTNGKVIAKRSTKEIKLNKELH